MGYGGVLEWPALQAAMNQCQFEKVCYKQHMLQGVHLYAEVALCRARRAGRIGGWYCGIGSSVVIEVHFAGSVTWQVAPRGKKRSYEMRTMCPRAFRSLCERFHTSVSYNWVSSNCRTFAQHVKRLRRDEKIRVYIDVA